MIKEQINSMQPQILIADDHSTNLKILRDALEPEGYSILIASDGKVALERATSFLPDAILLDIVMPVMDGYEVCRRLKQDKATEHIPVIFITIKDDKNSLIKGFQAGGVDYIVKPFDKEEVRTRVKSHLKMSLLTQELLQKNRELQQEIELREQAETEKQQAESALELAEVAHKQAEDALQKTAEQLSIISQQEIERWGIDAFVGKSKILSKIIEDVRKAQDAGTTSVLIVGESGTGKELVARAIHFGGERAKAPFIVLNCAAIPNGLAESTLFGHVRGAFTGADKSRKGYFELANGGTLFLDEIGEMSPELQPKLLRVIEDGCITPVGSNDERHVDVRIIAATNQNLQKKMAAELFSEALYFRLARFDVTLPPLRERKEDVPLLTKHFLNMLSAEMGVIKPALSPEAMRTLEIYHFPGNVRELKNIIEHALIEGNGTVIKPEHLCLIDQTHYVEDGRPDAISVWAEQPMDMKRTSLLVSQAPEQAEALMIKGALTQTEGNVEAASLLLHIDTEQIHQFLQNEGEKHNPYSEEKQILAYIREHGSITNAQCRELLDVDFNHASYLLKKMHRDGLLKREGKHRWACYKLP